MLALANKLSLFAFANLEIFYYNFFLPTNQLHDCVMHVVTYQIFVSGNFNDTSSYF